LIPVTAAGTLPAAWGRSGVFQQPQLSPFSLYYFDVSANRLSGRLPSFLKAPNVPAQLYANVFISVRNFPAPPSVASSSPLSFPLSMPLPFAALWHIPPATQCLGATAC
jgi:hypothetical protein